MKSNITHTSGSSARMVDTLCSWAVVLAGAWLIAAPMGWALDFSADSTATWSSVVVGVVAMLGAAGALTRLVSGMIAYAVAGLAGLWAILAPYVLEFEGGSGGDPAINSIVLGFAIVLLAVGGYAARTIDNEL